MAPKKSFNDQMMVLIGVPIVLGWLGFGCYIIWMGTQDEAIIDNIDGYATLLAIIGGPALLIVTSMLELWKSEQQTEINLHPEVVSTSQVEAANHTSHARLLEVQAQAHTFMLEHERQRVELGIHEGHVGHHHEQGVTSTDGEE